MSRRDCRLALADRLLLPQVAGMSCYSVVKENHASSRRLPGGAEGIRTSDVFDLHDIRVQHQKVFHFLVRWPSRAKIPISSLRTMTSPQIMLPPKRSRVQPASRPGWTSWCGCRTYLPLRFRPFVASRAARAASSPWLPTYGSPASRKRFSVKWKLLSGLFPAAAQPADCRPWSAEVVRSRSCSEAKTIRQHWPRNTAT
jgi:hypothetical protein